MAIITIDKLLSSEYYFEASVSSITRRGSNTCFRIILTTGIYYIEHRQTYPDITPTPLEAITNYDTDPETIYTKNYTIDYVWGAGVYEALYTNLVDTIQDDINGFMREQHIERDSYGACATLKANIYYDENWTP